MSAQNGPGSQGPNRPGPWRPQPPQVQAPVNPSPPPAQAMPQSGQVPPQQVPPQQSDERFRPRPQQQGRPPMPGGPPMQGQPPLQGQPPVQGQPPMQWQPPVPARVYAQPRFAPTVTQEMRMRAGMQAPPQMVTETPWTGAVRQSQPQTEPGSTENIIRLAIGIVVLVALFGGLLLMALLGGLSFGLRLFALIGLSAVPLIGIIAYVLWLDRWKPQPKILLGICLLWGAVAAVILTLVFSLFSDIALYMVGIDGVPSIIGAVFQAPVVEESTKTVLLVVIVLAARRYFEGPLDGLVYGALIGAGFAFTENILYLGGAWNENQFEGLIEIFILRCLCAPLLHTAFSTCAGVTIGFAARKWPWWSLILMWLPGLVFGMVLHSFWNGTMALLGAFPEIVNRIGLIVLSLILSGAWVALGLVLRRSERMHTQNMLGDYANSGWLTHAEVDMLGTWKGRKNGRRWAASFPGGKEEMRTMIRLSGKLSPTRMRVLAGIGGDQERMIERAELKRFSDTRDRLLAAAARPAR